MTRTITTHKLNGCNDQITVEANDKPGDPGDACHRYRMEGPRKQVIGIGMVPSFQTDIRFHRGPLDAYGPIGTTNEAMLAIVIDRLEGFQSGAFACDENAAALAHMREALAVLHSRTQKRLDRGVEGTLEP